MTLTANLVSGPGPRGLQGNTLRMTSAAPTSDLGQDGDAAHDTTNGLLYYAKANGAWDLTKKTNTRGPQGDAGLTSYAPPPEVLSGQKNCVAHATCGIASPYGGTAGATQLAYMGAPDVLCEYRPTVDSAFLGATFTVYSTAVTFTFQLLNTATGAVVFTSGAIGGNSDSTAATVGPFPATQYPMAAGGTYVWQATPSAATANLYCAVTPYYLTPSQGGPCPSNACFGVWGTAGETLTTTNVLMYHPGPVAGLRQNYKNPRLSYFVQATMMNATPVTLVFNIGNFTQSVPANSSAISGNFSPATQVNRAGDLNTWVVRTDSGTTTGFASAALQTACIL